MNRRYKAAGGHLDAPQIGKERPTSSCEPQVADHDDTDFQKLLQSFSFPKLKTDKTRKWGSRGQQVKVGRGESPNYKIVVGHFLVVVLAVFSKIFCTFLTLLFKLRSVYSAVTCQTVLSLLLHINGVSALAPSSSFIPNV